MSRSAARHAIAAALGVVRDGVGSDCACCGVSPYPSAGPVGKTLGVGFSDWAVLDAPAAPTLCVGCQRIMAGRPGDDPPPLRTRTFAIVDGALLLPDFGQMWAWVVEPPLALTVVSWAVSGQRHHALYAEESRPALWLIGSDTGLVRYRPASDRALVDAVLGLRAGDAKGRAWFTRTEILSGHYRSAAIASRSALRWQALEAVVAPRRGDPLVAFLVGHAPVTPDGEDEDPMIDPVDDAAARLLGAVARGSALRVADGKAFWGGLFLRRIQRHAGRPLAEFVSRLAADVDAAPLNEGVQRAVALVASYTTDQGAAVMDAIRRRTTLVTALAYQHRQEEVAAA